MKQVGMLGIGRNLWLPRLAVLSGFMRRRAIAYAADAPSIVGLRVGFDSRYKLGHWTPVEVTFDGATEAITGQVCLILPDGDGVPSVVTAPRPVQLLPGRPTAVLLYAKFGRAFSDLRVQFRADEKNLVDEVFDNHPRPDGLELPPPLADQDKLIVASGLWLGRRSRATARPEHRHSGHDRNLGCSEVNRCPHNGTATMAWIGSSFRQVSPSV